MTTKTTEEIISEETEPTITVITDSTTQISSDSICIEEGKIPVPSTECKIFLLCIFTSTGFKEKKYTCPSGYLFDPYKKKCTNTYVCSELSTISTTASTTPIIYSTEIASSEDILITSLDTSTTSNQISPCEENGKIPIFDNTCTKYLLCSMTNNGFVAKEYTCPPGFLFDPAVKRCSNLYVCPGLSSPVDTTIDTTDSSTTLIADILSTSSVNPTTLYTETSSAEESECKSVGKYPIPNSICTKYRLCVLTAGGLLGKTYSCPSGYLFNPDIKKCTNAYVCPEFNSPNIVTSKETEVDTDVITTTDSLTEILSNSSTSNPLSTPCATSDHFVPECIEEGKFPIIGSKCTQYVMCTRGTSGFRTKLYKCPENTGFNPDDSRCTFQYECTEAVNFCETTFKSPTTEPSTTTTSPETEIQFPECADQRKLPIDNTDCKKYFLCIWSSTGFISAMYSCPNETYFNPETERCSSTYDCLETKIRIKRNISPTCSTVGHFADPTDITCQYFYTCTEGADGAMLGVREKCKDGYYFDSDIQECSTTPNCNNNGNDLQFRSLSTNVISPRTLVNGRCTTIGRYLVEGTNCKNYVLCRATSNGTLQAINFKCPTTTVFNQVIQQCTSLYTCPDSACFMPGMIPNPNVKDCSSYITCTANLNNVGTPTFTASVQYCAPGTYYNPFMLFCDPDYVCPE